MPNTAGFRTVPHDMFPHDPTPRADFRSARSKDRDTRILRPPPDARARRVSKRRFFPGDRAPSLFSFFSFFQTREATVLEGERESSGGRGLRLGRRVACTWPRETSVWWLVTALAGCSGVTLNARSMWNTGVGASVHRSRSRYQQQMWPRVVAL